MGEMARISTKVGLVACGFAAASGLSVAPATAAPATDVPSQLIPICDQVNLADCALAGDAGAPTPFPNQFVVFERMCDGGRGTKGETASPLTPYGPNPDPAPQPVVVLVQCS